MEIIDLKNGKGHSLATLETEVKHQLLQFKKEKKAIQESDEPRLQVNGQKAWEIDRLKRTLDENIKAVDELYREMGNELIAEQEQKIAASYVKPSQSDKELAESIRDEFIFNVSMQTTDDGMSEEIRKVQKRIDSLNDGQKIAFKSEFPAMLSKVDDGRMQHKLRTAGHALKSVQTEDEAALGKLKEAVRSGASTPYRMELIAQQAMTKSAREKASAGDTIPLYRYETEYKSL